MSPDTDNCRVLHCPACGYNLTGLPNNCCPECGEAFDPARLLRNLDRRTPMTYGKAAMSGLLGIILVLALFTATIYTGNSGLLLLTIIPWFFGTIGISIFLAVRTVGDRLSSSTGKLTRTQIQWCIGLASTGIFVAQNIVIFIAKEIILIVFYAHGGRLPFDH